MFEDYWKEKQEYDEKKKREMQLILPDPASSPLFNNSILFKTIDDRDNMSDTELRYFIHTNFLSIMNNMFDRNVSEKYLIAFQDIRFLNAFIDVISNVRYFESDMIVKLNLLVYHYLALPNHEKDKQITDRMLFLSTIVNSTKAIALKKYNLPPMVEKSLLIARYSDFDINICVKRVDLMIVTSEPLMEMLNIDGISEAPEEAIHILANILVDLYRLEDWNLVLPYFMVDVLPSSNDNNPSTTWITPEVENMDSALNLAVIEVLDTKIENSLKLRNILTSYSEGYRIMNPRRPIRFSFKNISGDYPRLQAAVQYLRDSENIYVP